MSDGGIDQKMNIITETLNSNESTSTSAQNDQPQSMATDTNTPNPPPSSGSGEDGDDADEDSSSNATDEYHSSLGYADELDIEDYIENLERCVVCDKRLEMAVVCYHCSSAYCRQDAIDNIQVTLEWLTLTRHIRAWPGGDIITYACNVCLGTADTDFKGRRDGKALTLEMLCAFNIARKMWEMVYAPKKSIPSMFALKNSLSIMSSVDQSYADSPLRIRNFIKRAIFLLGLELDFHGSYEQGELWLEGGFVRIAHMSDHEDISRNRRSRDVKNSFNNEKNNNGGTNNDKTDCWERHGIKWTPQFTIRVLDFLSNRLIS